MERFKYRPRMVRLLLATLGVATVAYWGCRARGARRWDRGTRDLRGRLEEARSPMFPRTVDFRELGNLPAPVRRYFEAVLTEGQPMVFVGQVGCYPLIEIGDSGEAYIFHSAATGETTLFTQCF